MFENAIPVLMEVINSSESLVILYVSDMCSTEIPAYKTLENTVHKYGKGIGLYYVCFNEIEMPFPRIQPNTVYYFAPKNQMPLFWRIGPYVTENVQADIDAAFKMIESDTPYLEARFDKKVISKYLKTEKCLTEDISKYPEDFQKSRNYMKEVWKISRYNTNGFPFLVSAATANKRISICKKCPKFVKSEQKCKECGCVMTSKVHADSATCPLEKW